MPLISINLRDQGGLMSHMNYISTHVGRSLKDQVHSDLVFVCRCVINMMAEYQYCCTTYARLLKSVLQVWNCEGSPGNVGATLTKAVNHVPATQLLQL